MAGATKTSVSATLGPSAATGAHGTCGGEVTYRAQSEPILPAMLVANAGSPDSSSSGNISPALRVPVDPYRGANNRDRPGDGVPPTAATTANFPRGNTAANSPLTATSQFSDRPSKALILFVFICPGTKSFDECFASVSLSEEAEFRKAGAGGLMATGATGSDASRASCFASFGRQKFTCEDFTFIKVLGKGSFGKVSQY